MQGWVPKPGCYSTASASSSRTGSKGSGKVQNQNQRGNNQRSKRFCPDPASRTGLGPVRRLTVANSRLLMQVAREQRIMKSQGRITILSPSHPALEDASKIVAERGSEVLAHTQRWAAICVGLSIQRACDKSIAVPVAWPRPHTHGPQQRFARRLGMSIKSQFNEGASFAKWSPRLTTSP